MIILDASVLIAHFESADAHHADAADLLADHASEPLGSSVVTLAEIYAAAAERADLLDYLLSRLEVESLDLPAGSARRLGELRATTGLRMPDCCVLYTAEHHTAAIATFDAKLAARAAELGVPLAGKAGTLFTQPVTAPDLAAGRIRIPVATKPALPGARTSVLLVLRGRELEVRWDPRNGPDRARSGVLSVGRATLAEAVSAGERLEVVPRPDGRLELR
ncbi:type II toxin-antitoxin system VapC family toxin [Mycobacterium sp. GA-2829]|uniref:type II toxin-antitoxin system VapC family toxin n=1 Tax=Mycobacterium sp. GA-2829 TaxID=1772283 RepID=UPI0009EC5843|nr:type II toxin-antitoxin system VapC family toxin [Mycobacterium sp. GA-2829]